MSKKMSARLKRVSVTPKRILRKVNKTTMPLFGTHAVHPLIKKHLNIKEITMPKRLSLVIFTLTCGLIMMASPVRAEQNTAINIAATSASENTERNARDKGNTTLTPEDQKETKKDIKITSKIRKTVVRDKSLSVDAQNAKIITRNGVVTLRGPVASEAEKIKLQQITQQTKGVVQVDNQLENKAP
jgi:hypothetical protein